MRAVLVILIVVLVAGCIGTREVAAPTPAPTATSEPFVLVSLTPTPIPTPTALPETHECFVAENKTLLNVNAKAIEIQQCFMEREEYVECTYFMLKHAQLAEQDGTVEAGWSMALYSKVINCAKEAEKLPNADYLPKNLHSKLVNYFDCHTGNAFCTTTTEQVGQIVVEVGGVRAEFL